MQSKRFEEIQAIIKPISIESPARVELRTPVLGGLTPQGGSAETVKILDDPVKMSSESNLESEIKIQLAHMLQVKRN